MVTAPGYVLLQLFTYTPMLWQTSDSSVPAHARQLHTRDFQHAQRAGSIQLHKLGVLLSSAIYSAD